MIVYDGHCHLDAATLIDNPHNIAVAAITPEDIASLYKYKLELNPLAKIGIGLHPWKITNNTSIFTLDDNLQHYIEKYQPNFIGECGLDKLRDNFNLQLQVCELHCALAIKYNLPIVFHCVRAYNELLEIIKKYPKLYGIVHGFNANNNIARQFIKKNFKLGIGSIIFNQNSQLYKSINHFPLDSVIIESDAPYMPILGMHKSSISDCKIYATKLAAIKHMEASEVINQINQNWSNIFSQ